jgi:hypothetical protein
MLRRDPTLAALRHDENAPIWTGSKGRVAQTVTIIVLL